MQIQAWQPVVWDSTAPKQDNGFDCGVFVMVHANLSAKGERLSYDKDSIGLYWRRMCLLESMRGRVE